MRMKKTNKPSVAYEKARGDLRVSYAHGGKNGTATGKRTVVHRG